MDRHLWVMPTCASVWRSCCPPLFRGEKLLVLLCPSRIKRPGCINHRADIIFRGSVGSGERESLPAMVSGCMSLNRHEAILGAQQGSFPFSLCYKIPQFGSGESDRGLLPLIQAGLLQPGRLKAFRSWWSSPSREKQIGVQVGSSVWKVRDKIQTTTFSPNGGHPFFQGILRVQVLVPEHHSPGPNQALPRSCYLTTTTTA